MKTRFVFFIMLGLLSLITVQKLKSDVPPNMTEI